MAVKERILFALKSLGVEKAADFAEYGTNIYASLYKQLFSNYSKGVSTEVLSYVLEKFPEISADYIIRGEGTWKRSDNSSQTNHQEIHSDGAPIAVSQNGPAVVEDTKKEQAPEEPARIDVVKMFDSNDWGMVVSLIQQHNREIIALKDKQMADMQKEIDMLHTNHLFRNTNNGLGAHLFRKLNPI